MIRPLRITYFVCIYVLILILSNITYANENRQSTPELKVHFPIVDKVKVLAEEQKEEIFIIYSDYDCYSFIQISLLIVNSPNEVSGENFLTNFSGHSNQRVVIRLVTSTKEVGLFWTEALNGSLEGTSKNYRAKFEPYLTDGKFYEAALYGSLEIIKILSPEYKVL